MYVIYTKQTELHETYEQLIEGFTLEGWRKPHLKLRYFKDYYE